MDSKTLPRSFVTLALTLTGSFLLSQHTTLAGSHDSSRCPAHLAKVRGGHTAVHAHVCYLFVDEEVFWSRARDECYELGGEMLAIESEQTMRFIADTLSSRELGWRRKGVWLGARNHGNAWRWTNGRKVTYTNWAKGEPSRVLGPFSPEDCAQMRRDHGWEWHDSLCGSMRFHYNFICQFPLSKPSDTEGQVAPSAAQQEEDNGNTSIMVIIFSLGLSVLLLILIAVILLHLHHRRTKQRQAEPPVHYNNNHSSGNNNHSSPSGNGYSATSSGSAVQVPPGRPPLPPMSHRGEGQEVATPLLYSEVNKARTPPHLQRVNYHRGQGKPLQASAGPPPTDAPPIPALPSSLGSSPHSTSSHLLTGNGSDLGIDLERAPLMTPMTSVTPGLVNSGCTTSSEGSPLPPPFSIACGGAGMAERQPDSTYGPCTLTGDYVDMNSLMSRQQGHSQTPGKVVDEEAPDEDKHTYTNVDHRDEKVENVYEVLP